MFQYRKILVPLDGSKLAESALETAVLIAKSSQAGLVLLRVIEPLLHAADEQVRGQLRRIKEDEAEAYLQKAARPLQAAGIPLEIVLRSGAVAEAIIECANEHQVDLTLMSSHGRSGVSRWVYGSVAEKVLRHGSCATIILQANAEVPMLHHKRVLVTLDGSALAERAIEPSVAYAQATGSELLLLRVTSLTRVSTEVLDPLAIKQDMDKLEAQERKEARAYLGEIKDNLAETGLQVQVEVTSGPVAETILAYAEKNRIDLISMSSHGRSGVSRWFYGSVTEKVLRGGHCAMLITRECNR